MVALGMHFETLDSGEKDAVRTLARGLSGVSTLGLDDRTTKVIRDFLRVLADSDGVVFGPLDSQLSPEQASTILGVSRPLVVRRMDDGRLPFTMVGAHRRCLLKDVLTLRAREQKTNETLAELYDLHEEIENAPGA